MNLSCCYLLTDATPCGADAEPKRNLPLCEHHSHIIYLLDRGYVEDAVFEFASLNPEPNWGEGFSYYLLLPNGNVKIGYCIRADRLSTRWQVISRQHGGRVTPLATEHGGQLKELYVHRLLRHSRIVSAGEQFLLSAEVSDRIASVGHCSEAIEQIRKFSAWSPTKPL